VKYFALSYGKLYTYIQILSSLLATIMSLVTRNSVSRSIVDGTGYTALHLTTDHSEPIYTVKFNRYGNLAASGGKDQGIVIWNMDSLTNQKFAADTQEVPVSYDFCPAIHKSAITWIAWSQIDDPLMFLSSADSTASIFDINKGCKIKTFHHNGSVNQLDVSKKDTLITCSDDSTVKLWDTRSKFPVSVIKSEYPILSCCIDLNEAALYFAGIDPAICCYDPRDISKPLWREANQSSNVTSLSLAPGTSDYLISKSVDGSIKYFDSRTVFSKGGSSIAHRRHAKPYVFDGSQANEDDWLIHSKLVTDSDGKLKVISASSDGYIYVWDFASRKLLFRFEGHSGPSYDVDCFDDRLISCSVDGSLIVRDL